MRAMAFAKRSSGAPHAPAPRVHQLRAIKAGEHDGPRAPGYTLLDVDVEDSQHSQTKMSRFCRSLRLALLGVTCVVVGTLGLAVNAANHLRDLTPAARFETYQSAAQPDVGLRFIRNSGVCETTPGVDQLSGYIDFGTNMSMVSRPRDGA